MNNQPDDPRHDAEQKHSGGDAHLMCRTSLWGIAGFAGCSYFAWVSFAHIVNSELEWPHDLWTAGTYLVWIVLLGTLAFDTRCVRERIFFGALLVNFLIGLGLTLWGGIPEADVRTARLGTGALWSLGALMSLTTVGRAGKVRKQV